MLAGTANNGNRRGDTRKYDKQRERIPNYWYYNDCNRNTNLFLLRGIYVLQKRETHVNTSKTIMSLIQVFWKQRWPNAFI